MGGGLEAEQQSAEMTVTRISHPPHKQRPLTPWPIEQAAEAQLQQLP